MAYKILVLGGDGIGSEVCREALRILEWVENDSKKGVSPIKLDIHHGLIGGISYDTHGEPLTRATLSLAKSSDAVLLGAVGGEKYDNLARSKRPEAGLLELRKELDVYANLRPAVVFEALSDASSLREEVVRGLDLMIVRELTAGVYFGEPRGMDKQEDGTMRCIDTQSYTQGQIERVVRVAFNLARKRKSVVHSVEKANVMETGYFWRGVVRDLHNKEGSGIELHNMYADNCCMQLVRDPKQFDCIVTDNLFGDILSDCAAMLTGSIGMLPSASLGDIKEGGYRAALYEPVHGSAPDIAGSNVANPCAMILSVGMMLKYSFDLDAYSNKIERAINNVLKRGIRTKDIIGYGRDIEEVSCSRMSDYIIEEMGRL